MEGGQTVTDEAKGCRKGSMWTCWRWWVSLRQVQETRQHSKSHIHIAWNRDVLIAHPLPSLPEAPHCISGVMLNYPQRQFRLSLWLSYLCLSPSIHPSREHQQRFCPGLHQWVPDSEWPAGQRKPTLLSRIHSHRQGELLNGRWL